MRRRGRERGGGRTHRRSPRPAPRRCWPAPPPRGVARGDGDGATCHGQPAGSTPRMIRTEPSTLNSPSRASPATDCVAQRRRCAGTRRPVPGRCSGQDTSRAGCPASPRNALRRRAGLDPPSKGSAAARPAGERSTSCWTSLRPSMRRPPATARSVTRRTSCAHCRPGGSGESTQLGAVPLDVGGSATGVQQSRQRPSKVIGPPLRLLAPLDGDGHASSGRMLVTAAADGDGRGLFGE